MLHQFILNLLSLFVFGGGHSLLEEALLSSLLDLLDLLHCLDCLHHQLSVVASWDVAALLELENWVYCHFLTMCCSVSLGPFELAGVPLGLEKLVALRAAETEHLTLIKIYHVLWNHF